MISDEYTTLGLINGEIVMSASPTVSIELLADHPHLIPAVGEIRWKEWGYPPEPEQLDWWVETTTREASHDHLPISWVAIDPGSQAIGAVGLGQFDVEERRDRSPWVLGMIVKEQYRGLGIGSKLMKALEVWAYHHGYTQAWVATGGRAVHFYQKCGWTLSEIINRSSGEVMSVLTKSLNA
jgi:GNAT superfamily N-acetyltransferase